MNSYAASDYASYNVCLKAIGETIKDDIGGQWVISFLEINNTFQADVWHAAKTINSLRIMLPLNGGLKPHIVALVLRSETLILEQNGYGTPQLCNNIIAYSEKCTQGQERRHDCGGM